MKIGFDFDGILSRIPLRKILYFVGRPLREAYRKVIITASPNRWTHELILNLRAKGHEVVIITGRPEVFKSETREWLANNGLASLRVYHNPKPDFSTKQQIVHKKRSIGRLGVKVYIEDQPRVAKGIAQMGGVEVVLHTGKPQETVKDVWDAIGDVKKKNPETFETYATREGKTALREIQIGDLLEVYYPVTGNFFKAKMLTMPVNKKGEWYATVLDPNGDEQRTVWNGRYFILGDIGCNPPPQVVISVPHAVGIPTATGSMKGHDYIAKEMALKLAERLGVPNAHIVIGDIPRDVLDLNRERSRWKTEFRKRLRELIRRHPGDTIHLDVHSFRVNSKVYAGNDVAIATTEKRARPHEIALRDYLVANGVRCRIYTEMLMDVVPEGRELGVPVSYLIEFNEGATAEQKNRYADLVSIFIKKAIEMWPPTWPSESAESGTPREVEPQANPAAGTIRLFNSKTGRWEPMEEPMLARFGERFHHGHGEEGFFLADDPRRFPSLYYITKRDKYALFLSGHRTDDRYDRDEGRRKLRERWRREYEETLSRLKREYDLRFLKEIYVADGIYGKVWIIEGVKRRANPPLEDVTPWRQPVEDMPFWWRVKYALLGVANPQGPLRTPTQAEREHEEQRIQQMGMRELRTRLGRMAIPQKLFAFLLALDEAEMPELANEVRVKLATLGYDGEGNIITRPRRPERRREQHPAEAASWDALNGGQKTQIFERMDPRPSIRDILAWTLAAWADLPQYVKEQLIVTYGVMWDDSGVRSQEPERRREVHLTEEADWNHLTEAQRVPVLERLEPRQLSSDVERWSREEWEDLPAHIRRGLVNIHGPLWHDRGVVLDPPVHRDNILHWNQLRAGDLVRAVSYPDAEYGVVKHVGSLDAAGDNENSVWALWEATETEAVRKWSHATETQFLPGTRHGGDLTHYPGIHENGEPAEFEVIARNLAPSTPPPEMSHWSVLTVGDLVEITRQFARGSDERFAVVYHVGRLHYDARDYGEHNSIWGLWQNTALLAKRKYLEATDFDLRPFMPGLLKHQSDDGPIYRVWETRITRTPEQHLASVLQLLDAKGAVATAGSVELYYAAPKGQTTPYTELEPNFEYSEGDVILMSTHPEIGLQLGDGQVVQVKVPVAHLSVLREYPHRADFQLGGPGETWPMESTDFISEPFNVRAVGVVRHNPECVLCSDLQTPKVYYEDPFIVICDDIKHEKSILAMIKRHAKEPEEWERKWLMRVLNYTAGEAFPTEYEIQQTMNTEPTHWHVHAVGNPHHAPRSTLQIIESVQ